MAAARDPDTAFFKKLDGFQPCEINDLKAGNHVFAVYGKNYGPLQMSFRLLPCVQLFRTAILTATLC